MGKSELTNIDIAVYALYRLGGLERRVHTEEVAKGCYDLAPERFSWERYPEYPAREPGRSSLFDARKPKNGALVTGDQVKGWMLTPEGVEWLAASRARIEGSLGERGPAKRLPTDRRLSELLRSSAFEKFMEHGEQAEISYAEFAESLVCTVNTNSEVLNDRLQQFHATAEQLGREEVKDYVTFCRKKFASML
jgi:hypothetical protein